MPFDPPKDHKVERVRQLTAVIEAVSAEDIATILVHQNSPAIPYIEALAVPKESGARQPAVRKDVATGKQKRTPATAGAPQGSAKTAADAKAKKDAAATKEG